MLAGVVTSVVSAGVAGCGTKNGPRTLADKPRLASRGISSAADSPAARSGDFAFRDRIAGLFTLPRSAAA